jgi:hypothetical protein
MQHVPRFRCELIFVKYDEPRGTPALAPLCECQSDVMASPRVQVTSRTSVSLPQTVLGRREPFIEHAWGRDNKYLHKFAEETTEKR